MMRYINIVSDFLDILHHPVSYLKQRSKDWAVSRPSGKSLLSWAQSFFI
jgi:hypothetical protein